MSSALKALRTSGRAIVTRATPSATASVISRPCAGGFAASSERASPALYSGVMKTPQRPVDLSLRAPAAREPLAVGASPCRCSSAADCRSSTRRRTWTPRTKAIRLGACSRSARPRMASGRRRSSAAPSSTTGWLGWTDDGMGSRRRARLSGVAHDSGLPRPRRRPPVAPLLCVGRRALLAGVAALQRDQGQSARDAPAPQRPAEAVADAGVLSEAAQNAAAARHV